MQENVAKLYPNAETSAKVMSYSIAHSTPLPDWLEAYNKWGCENTARPDFLISTYQAQMLIFLARIVGVKRVLEIGVYVGFSAMVWSHAVGEGGSVVGLELSDEYAGVARRAFADNGVRNVEVKVGDALESLAALDQDEQAPFDLIFLDANKEAYPAYLAAILARSQPGAARRLLRRGGLIVADNVLRRAMVADATPANPHWREERQEAGNEALVAALREFNERLRAEPRVESFLVPLFDGLGLGRLVD